MDSFNKALIKKYPDIDPKILKGYSPPEKYVIFNAGDPDLHPIKYKMPEPPEYHLIDGFGKPAGEQFFVREKMPEKLEKLTKRTSNMNKIWEELDDNRGYYAEELKWIYLQWYYRLNGYWFFNDGVPTYITGQNWFFLNWWRLESSYPDYLYRDRIFFLFTKYCFETTTATFYYRLWDTKSSEYMHFSKRTQAEKMKSKLNLSTNIEEGEYVVDYGKRVCYGFNYPKFKREGATTKASCINYEIMSRTANEKSYIQSKDEYSARENPYKKVLYGFKNMPFFFLPQFKGSTDPRDGIIFSPPSQKIGAKGAVVNFNLGLESSILYATADEYAIEGERCYYYHGDEVGQENRSVPYDLIKRWQVVGERLERGDNIHGLCINTSTSGDTKGRAGMNYRKLCNMSHWEERNPITGRTESGLFNLFTSSEINFGGYTDKHGNPIVTNPTEKQKKELKIREGAREFLAAKLDAAKDKPSEYNHLMRDYPRTYREAFMSSADDSGFNIVKLTSHITTLEMDRTHRPLVGNLLWKKEFEEVEFKEDPDGRFTIYQLPVKPNASKKTRGLREPVMNDTYAYGVDPAKFEKKKATGKKSDASGLIFRRHDSNIDDENTLPSERTTKKFVALYSSEVYDMEESYIDMMKFSIWYSVSIFPEYNAGDIEARFKNNGLKKYLKYRYVNGKRADMAGVYMNNDFKQQIFIDYMNYIENEIEGDRMVELWRECRDIDGLDDMTNYDKFTAGGLCWLSLRNDQPKFEYYRRKNEDKDAKDDAVVEYILRARKHR